MNLTVEALAAEIHRIACAANFINSPKSLAESLFPFIERHIADRDGILDFDPDENFTVSDMANVGYSLMNAIKEHRPEYNWNDSPAEIVGDLCNEIEESPQPPKPAGAVPIPDPSGETYPFYGLNQLVTYGDAREAAANADAGRADAVPVTSGHKFLIWCTEWFGPDSDEDHLARAVLALPQQPAAEDAPRRQPKCCGGTGVVPNGLDGITDCPVCTSEPEPATPQMTTQGEVVWQYRQVAAPNGWHDLEDESEAEGMTNDGYEVRKLYTHPSPVADAEAKSCIHAIDQYVTLDGRPSRAEMTAWANSLRRLTGASHG